MTEIEWAIELVKETYAVAYRDEDYATTEDGHDLLFMLDMAHTALREKQERDNPRPLKLEELRGMSGEAVYYEDSCSFVRGVGAISIDYDNEVRFEGVMFLLPLSPNRPGVPSSYGCANAMEDGGNFYAHKPKEAEHE